MRRRSTGGIQSEKGKRWMEQIATLGETRRLQGRRWFPLFVEVLQERYEGQNPDLGWIEEFFASNSKKSFETNDG